MLVNICTDNMSSSPFSTGVTIPTMNFVNSVSSDFPNPNRMYKVESGVVNRYLRDYLPINANISNGSVDDNYIEFVINSNDQEFIDLNSFVMEVKLRITTVDGKILEKGNHVSVVDGCGHRLLSRFTLFLNGAPVESNSYFGLYNSLRTYTSMPRGKLDGIGRNMYYKTLSTDIDEEFTENSFIDNLISMDEKKIIKECKSVLHMMTPLHFDMSSSGFYLLNGVDVRLRFDLAPASVLLNSYDDAHYRYSLQSAKIWVRKVVPHNEALISLNSRLSSLHSSVEYVVDRPIIKNFVFPMGQSILSLDNIFNGIVPHIIYVFFMKQRNSNGDLKRNSAYFTHCNMSAIRMELNGNTVTSLTSNFPDQIASVFHHTIFNIKEKDGLISLQNFKKGRTIYAWDLSSSDCCDDLKIEKTGNVRMSVQLSTPNTENVIAYVVGVTTRLVEIDSNRRVKTSYLM